MSGSGWKTGRVVRPTNRHYATGIHNDEIATDLGLRGGTIAGSAHLDTFVPLLLDQFGDAWFEQGNISMYFRHATVDDEPVRALIDSSENEASTYEARIETADGTLVGEGSVALGSRTSALRSRDLRHDASTARILSALTVGEWPQRTIVSVNGERLGQRCQAGLITEVLDRYYRPATSAPPSAVVDLANDAAHALLSPHLSDAVGLWGALEVGFLDGPIEPDVPYEATLTIVAIAESPQTELLWHDVAFRRADPETDAEPDGRIVAEVRILSRFMKASSPLWA